MASYLSGLKDRATGYASQGMQSVTIPYCNTLNAVLTVSLPDPQARPHRAMWTKARQQLRTASARSRKPLPTASATLRLKAKRWRVGMSRILASGLMGNSRGGQRLSMIKSAGGLELRIKSPKTTGSCSLLPRRREKLRLRAYRLRGRVREERLGVRRVGRKVRRRTLRVKLLVRRLER